MKDEASGEVEVRIKGDWTFRRTWPRRMASPTDVVGRRRSGWVESVARSAHANLPVFEMRKESQEFPGWIRSGSQMSSSEPGTVV